ncbi:MAG: hypothetical protein AMXMBFR84_23450 [Candidatus Hydrogenedentota bacterium]
MKAQIQRLFDAIDRGRRFATHDIWYVGRPGEPVPQGFIIKQIRVLILLVRNLVEDALLLRAAALTFVTILAVVPFLAVAFYVIQEFELAKNLPDLIERTTGQNVSTMTESEIKKQFIAIFFPEVSELGSTETVSEDHTASPDTATAEPAEKIDPVTWVLRQAEGGSDPKAIGLVGLFFVIAAVFGLMRNIESSFNSIWGITQRRSWYRMFSDYFIISILLPFLVVGILAVTAILNSGVFAELALGINGLKYLVIWSAFSILYIAVPNTRVQWRYGILGGIVAGSMWSFSAWAYVAFQVGVSRNELLYSGFALFPLLLTWIYLSWIILLFGAEVAFAYQNEKTFAMERLASTATFAYREAVAIRAMIELARRFDTGQPGLTVTESAEAWNVPIRLLSETLDQLEKADLARRCATIPESYAPARSLDKISIGDIVYALREHGRDPSLLREDEMLQPLLYDMARQRNGALHASLYDALQKFYPPQPVLENEVRAALTAEIPGSESEGEPR